MVWLEYDRHGIGRFIDIRRIRERLVIGEGGYKYMLPALLLLLIALHAFPLLAKDTLLWGVDQWRYFSKPVAFAVLLAGFIITIPQVGSRLVRTGERIGEIRPVTRFLGYRMVSIPVMLVFAAALFWLFRNTTHFLGDGFLWANHLPKAIVFQEPASSWLYRGLYRALNAVRILGEINPVKSSAITSILAGLLFLVYALKTAKLLGGDRGESLFFVLALLSNGAIMLFFGYVEAYPPVAACVMAVIYHGAKKLLSGGSAVPVIVWTAVTIVLHMSAVVLLPGLVVLFLLSSGREIDTRKYSAVLCALVVVFIVVLWLLRRIGPYQEFFDKTFLPMFAVQSKSRMAYPVFSLQALFDLFNELILVCPLVIFLPAGFLIKGARKNPSDPGVKIFIGTTALFYILGFIVFNKIIGASRDWDLFSPLAVPLVLWTALILRNRLSCRTGTLSVLAFAVILVHTAPWIVLNASAARSEARFIDLADHGYWSNQGKGYGYSTLGQYFRHLGDIRSAIKYYKKAASVDPGNVKYNYYIGDMYTELKDHVMAASYYRKVIDRDEDHLTAWNNLGASYLELGELGHAEKVFLEVLARDPAYVPSIKNLGYIYLETGQPEKAFDLYKENVGSIPAINEYFKELAFMYLERATWKSALAFLEKLAGMHPDDVNLHYSLGMFLLERKDFESAARHLELVAGHHPEDTNIRVRLAEIYCEIGDFEAAGEHVRAARELNAAIPEELLDILEKNTGEAVP